VLDGGPCHVGVESTILDLTDPARPRILRPGAVTAAKLEKFLGVEVASGAPSRSRSRKAAGLLAPGLLPQHYSPRTPLVIKRDWKKLPAHAAGIYLRRPTGDETAKNVYWLSQRAALSEIARNLYHTLREADHGGYKQIWIEALPEDSAGLTAAINDRLKRAAAKRTAGRDR
jgi:L-threonylcarbamoyladenylate synthase